MVSFALALVAIVGAGGGHVLQLVPVETVLILRVEAQCILMLVVGGVIVPQLIHDIEQKLPVSDHRCSRVRRQNMLRGHFADRDVLLVAGVVAAGEACFFKRGIQQRVRAGQQVLTGGINGADEEVDRCGAPLGRQGDVLLNSSGEVILFIAQIPAGEGIAGLRGGGSRLGRGEAVFHFLLGRNGRAAVRVEGDGILVDVPLCRQGDVLCDGGIKVIRGGGLLVFAQIPEGKGEALERRVGRRDSLLAALDVLLIGRRRTAVSVEGNGIFLRHIHEALRPDLPAAPVPDQRDRNELLIVSDMFRVRERLVELGHIEVGEIADVAKPVVPVLPRLADEVVFIVLAEQTVGVLMLLRIIYDALDLNSHFKLFQLVSRRGFGLHRRPLCGVGHSLGDLLGNCGLPAGERVALAERVFAELGGIIAGLEARGDLILEDLAFNAVGVGDGEGVCGRGHFMRGFDPRVRCRVQPLPISLIIGEVELDGLRGGDVVHPPE